MTRKRGHDRIQINPEDGSLQQGKSRRPRFLAELTTLSLAFCLVHVVSLAVLLDLVVKEGPIGTSSPRD
jgi:hypothetical protein